MSWIVLRLVAYLVVLAIGASFVTFLWTHDRRWLRFAWQIFKYALILILIVLALFALERLVLVA
jgi:cellulose synthase/poly-beta-1,6-N-acetylglucosamine synthase-like glycosyltransferase